MNRSLAWLPLIAFALLCGCVSSAIRSLPKGEAVLNISLSQKAGFAGQARFQKHPFSRKLGAKLYREQVVHRPRTGTKLFTNDAALDDGHGRRRACKTMLAPANERVTEDKKVAVWEEAGGCVPSLQQIVKIEAGNSL